MRKRAFRIVLLLVMFFIPAVLEAGVSTGAAVDADLTGNYTIILYGGRHSADVETVVFLLKKESGYSIEPYAPQFDFKTEDGISATAALQRARSFAGRHPAVNGTMLSSIRTDGGSVIGYEIRPIYSPSVFGVTDTIDVSYKDKGPIITVYIKLKPMVERALFGSGDMRDDR